jgi:uncharacterized membrane protein YdjX (TVP38/TMEM64 family)
MIFSRVFSGRWLGVGAVLLTTAAIAAGLYYCGESLWAWGKPYYELLWDREKAKSFIASFGLGAPVVFMVIQTLQVLFAPVPGEATGFIGGFLFGTVKGFFYSSVALTAGSWINFTIGRFLGTRYVRKLIPAQKLDKFDQKVKHQGIIVLFILFVFPGFPKDYLCFFLGVTAIPLKVFILLAAIGRMPGTFILSLQGAFLFDQMYGLLAIVFGLCLVLALVGYRYREEIYRWVDSLNNHLDPDLTGQRSVDDGEK